MRAALSVNELQSTLSAVRRLGRAKAGELLNISRAAVQVRLVKAREKKLIPETDLKLFFPGSGRPAAKQVDEPPPAPAPAPKPLTRHEPDEIWKRYKAEPTDELRNALVERYLSVVKYNAERLWSRLPDGVELDDLISAGTFGLMDAVEAFDITRGVKFETYCVPRIRGAMLDELRHLDWVPRLVRSKVSQIGTATRALEAKLGREPSVQELAQTMELSVPKLEAMQAEASVVSLISLDKKWYETDSYKDVREVDILEDARGEDPTRRLRTKELIRYVMRGLNREERLILLLYYFEAKTMKDIGEQLGLSESRVSQMHSAVIVRIREARSYEEVALLL